MRLTTYTTTGRFVETRDTDSLGLSDAAYSLFGGQRVLLFAEPNVVAEHQMLSDVATLRVDELTVDPVMTLRHLLTKKVILCSIDLNNKFEIDELASMWEQITGCQYYAIAEN